MSNFHEVFAGRASRRAVIGGAMATGALLAARPIPAWSQEMQTHLPPGVEPKPKGPLVFRDFDQEELNYAYDQAPWLSDREAIAAQGRQIGDAANTRLGPPRELTYGPAEVEKLYLSASRRPNAPINVYIHGGAWRAPGARRDYLREIFFDAGAHFITVGFTTVTDTGGDLMPLADQVRRAVAWIYRNAPTFGGDPEKIFVSGHSSGGHLAGVILTTDWQNDFGLPMNIVKGGLCCSGMYDLYPVSLSSRNTYVRFTDEVVESLSPQRHLDKLVAPLIVAYGTRETPEFQRQGREFAEAIRSMGKPVTHLVGDGLEHFEIRLTLSSPYGLLGRAVLQQMGLAPV